MLDWYQPVYEFLLRHPILGTILFMGLASQLNDMIGRWAAKYKPNSRESMKARALAVFGNPEEERCCYSPQEHKDKLAMEKEDSPYRAAYAEAEALSHEDRIALKAERRLAQTLTLWMDMIAIHRMDKMPCGWPAVACDCGHNVRMNESSDVFHVLTLKAFADQQKMLHQMIQDLMNTPPKGTSDVSAEHTDISNAHAKIIARWHERPRISKR